jgi:6-phosphogluconolactonase
MDLVPWPRLHVWWGDDRYVPRDHPLSNAKPFDDVVAGIAEGEEGTAGGGWPGEPLPFDQIHPFRAGEAIATARGQEWCAAAMADELRADGPAANDEGWPVFDVLLLGVGADGHILSVFPGSPALGSTELAIAIPAPTHIEPHVPRVTLNPAVVSAAREVIVVVTGPDKAPVLGEVFGPRRDPARWPAQLARRPGATWIVDAAAAANLPSRP